MSWENEGMESMGVVVRDDLVTGWPAVISFFGPGSWFPPTPPTQKKVVGVFARHPVVYIVVHFSSTRGCKCTARSQKINKSSCSNLVCNFVTLLCAPEPCGTLEPAQHSVGGIQIAGEVIGEM